MLRESTLKFVVTAALAAAPAAQGKIIWADDFTGQTSGAFPNRDFTGNSSNDYNGGTQQGGFYTVNGDLGAPSPALTFADTSPTLGGVLVTRMSEFSSFSLSETTPILKVSFDFRIDSFLSVTPSQSFRFVLRADAKNEAGSQLVVVFNRGNVNDGDSSIADLAFAVDSPATSYLSPSDSTAIGLIPGVGWMPGFDFGEYDSTDDTANNTDGAFYRVSFSYDFNSGAVNGLFTRIATDATNGLSAPFAVSMKPGLVFSNTDSNDQFIIASSGDTTGVAHFDNFVFEAVPEPSVASGLLLGIAALGVRRRRKTA